MALSPSLFEFETFGELDSEPHRPIFRPKNNNTNRSRLIMNHTKPYDGRTVLSWNRQRARSEYSPEHSSTCFSERTPRNAFTSPKPTQPSKAKGFFLLIASIASTAACAPGGSCRALRCAQRPRHGHRPPPGLEVRICRNVNIKYKAKPVMLGRQCLEASTSSERKKSRANF